jgi:hypothetical protein
MYFVFKLGNRADGFGRGRKLPGCGETRLEQRGLALPGVLKFARDSPKVPL